ncbi:MAG: contact-dependent growth inhibition system immunity protein [Gemmatimonadaceae bacterium]
MSPEDITHSGSGSSATAPHTLLQALVQGSLLSDAVPRTLTILEEAPLASAGCFCGDLLRGLMAVPATFWTRQPALYQRYRTVLHDGAALRWSLAPEERDAFWSSLDLSSIASSGARRAD